MDQTPISVLRGVICQLREVGDQLEFAVDLSSMTRLRLPRIDWTRSMTGHGLPLAVLIFIEDTENSIYAAIPLNGLK